MRSFWGLMRAYWFSERWKEAWGADSRHRPPHRTIQQGQRLAGRSLRRAGQFDRYLPRSGKYDAIGVPADQRRPCSSCSWSSRMQASPASGTCSPRHLHRKWRGWLNGRFNDALLDGNHTHFHLQHGASVQISGSAAAPDNVDQRVQESIKGMTGGAIGLAMGIAGVVTSLFFVGQKLLEIVDQGQRPRIPRRLWQRRAGLRGRCDLRAPEHPHRAEARPPARAADRQDAAGRRQLSRRADHAFSPQLPRRSIARRGRAESDARPALHATSTAPGQA